MANDNTTTRKSRAEGIHRQIEALKAKKDGTRSNSAPPVPETPAEFVHRRMQELELKTKKKKDST